MGDGVPEDLLALARRHVVEGEKRIARQEATVAKIIASGDRQMALKAEDVLHILQCSLDLARAHLLRLEQDRGHKPPRPR